MSERLASEGGSAGTRLVRALDRISVAMRPTLFAYQFVLHLQQPSAPELVSRDLTQSSAARA